MLLFWESVDGFAVIPYIHGITEPKTFLHMGTIFFLNQGGQGPELDISFRAKTVNTFNFSFESRCHIANEAIVKELPCQSRHPVTLSSQWKNLYLQSLTLRRGWVLFFS